MIPVKLSGSNITLATVIAVHFIHNPDFKNQYNVYFKKVYKQNTFVAFYSPKNTKRRNWNSHSQAQPLQKV